ncbi:MAG: carbohydrate porin [Roseibium sp.]
MTLSAPALSNPNKVSQPNVGPPIAGRFENLTDNILPTSKHHLSDELSLPEYHQWKRELSVTNGIDFLIQSAPIYQISPTNGKSYLDNELDLYFNWRLFESDRTTGSIFFWGLYVQTFTEAPTGAYASSLGLLTLPNGGATDPNKAAVAPAALWWQQEFNSGFNFRIGQLLASSLWGANSYLGDDRETFMNSVFAANQGVPWSSGNRGLGAMAGFDAGPFYLSAGVQDAKGDQSSIDFQSFSDGKFAYLAEIGLTPTLPDGRSGKYSVTIGHVDRTGTGAARDQRDGWGVIVSAEQDINDRLAAFGILRRSWGRFAGNMEMTAGAGLIAKAPFGWTDDQIGLGGFFAKPHDTMAGTLRNEFGVEAYWRAQLTPRLDFTPDVQVYLQPGRKTTNDPVFVFGARTRVAF